MSGYLKDSDILMCKHVTITNAIEDMTYTCSLSGLPCEDVLRCSDGCSYEKVEEDRNPSLEELFVVQ